MGRHVKPYPPELRERAVRMVRDSTPAYPSQWAAIKAVADKLGIGTAETLRLWVHRSEPAAPELPCAATSAPTPVPGRGGSG